MAKELKQILAHNLRERMKQSYLDTQMKVHHATEIRHPRTQAVLTPGLTQSTIQRILSAQVNVTLDTLQRLADAFGVAPGSLLSSDESPVLPDASDLAWGLLDKFETLPQNPELRAQAFSACLIALGIVERQHAPQTPAPKLVGMAKK